jgi:hypothetical protein
LNPRFRGISVAICMIVPTGIIFSHFAPHDIVVRQYAN